MVWRAHVIRFRFLCGLKVTKSPFCPYHHHKGTSTEENSSCPIQEPFLCSGVGGCLRLLGDQAMQRLLNPIRADGVPRVLY